MFVASLPMVYTFRNLFILREFVLMLVASTKKPFFKNNSNYVYTLKPALKWFRVGNYQGQ